MDAIPSHPLVVSDRPFLHPRLLALSSLLAEYSFANLYLFRATHHYRLVEGEGFPVIGYSRKGGPFLLPTSLQPEDMFATKQLAKQHRLPLFPISEEWLPLFSPFSDKTKDPDDNDYLFSHQTLSTYPGRKLDKKRNLVSQFLRYKNTTLLPMEENTQFYALEVLKNWQSHVKEPPHLSDFFPCQEALSLLNILELRGSIVFVEGKPAGFFLGEWNTPNCFTIHFCKGDIAYKGIYPYLFQKAAKAAMSMAGECWINLEQDLGKPTLRKAKMAYHPDQLLSKYLVWVDF